MSLVKKISVGVEDCEVKNKFPTFTLFSSFLRVNFQACKSRFLCICYKLLAAHLQECTLILPGNSPV